jgi:hypothetical protein
MRTTWRKHCEDIGTRVTLEHDGRTFAGTALDLDDQGDLIVQLDHGEGDTLPPRPRRAPGRSGPSNAAGPTTATAGAQVTVCAALCALAAATGVVRVLGELTEQLNTARAAVGYGGAAICIGAFFGLVVPRRIIRRRLGGEADSHGGAGPGVRFEFAATLAGVLILCLALVWTGLLGLASGLESYRILLTHRFVHPPGVTRLLMEAPVGLGLALLGAAGSTLLVALHGWLRLLQKDRLA